MVHRPRSRAALTAVTVLLALAATGCSDEGDGTAPETSEASPDAPAGEPDALGVPTSATVRKVIGRLSTQAREQVRDRVVAAVDAWFDAAYVAGDYPRKDFADAFPTFTPGAAARARGDLALMSNAGVGESVDSVRVRAREVEIDVLVHEGRPAAATVAFRLGLAMTGDVERNDRVRGRLLLTCTGDQWRIFGYDVERGAV